MEKSSRHSKITGDFGETLMSYWLSKHGFECAIVDHVGIDIIARRPDSTEVLGISVKCRSRSEERKSAFVRFDREDDPKILEACKAFGCTPYVGIVADQGSAVRGFLTSLAHARSLSAGQGWLMSAAKVREYKADDAIEFFELQNGDGGW
jgi:Holliday junction resolvase-like predicted endonuclease